MSAPKQARAEARALLSVIPIGVAAGAVVGAALGGAYLAGGLARDAVLHAQNAPIARAAADGISQDSLRVMAQADPGALSVALRYDPNLLAGYTQRERQLPGLAHGAATNLFLRASVAINYNPAAQPFHSSALDQTRQLDCLTQAVYYEARGETPAGQAAVAQVVLNRVRHPAFPKSICAVVYQGAEDGRGCQFSFACNGSTNAPREPSAWTRAQKVAARALSGYVMADVGNATHFHVAALSPNWGGMLQVAEVGAHIFYRFSGVRGGPNAFHGKPTDEPASPEVPMAAVALDPVPVQVSTAPAQAAATPAVAEQPVAGVAKTTPAA